MTIDTYLEKSQEVISMAEKMLATDPAKARRLLKITLEEHTNLLSLIARQPKARRLLADQLKQCEIIFNRFTSLSTSN